MSEQTRPIDSKPSNKVLLIEKIRGGGSNDFISPGAMEKLNKLMKEGEDWRYLKKDNADYYLDGKLFHTDFLKGEVNDVKIIGGKLPEDINEYIAWRYKHPNEDIKNFKDGKSLEYFGKGEN